jgi:hypothetical protein
MALAWQLRKRLTKTRSQRAGAEVLMTNAINILIADDDADIWAGGLKRNLQDLPHINIATAYPPAECKIAVAKQPLYIPAMRKTC